MRVVIVSPRARVDLLEIWDYIAADDLQAADGMIDRIEQGIELLGEFPGAGHERAEVR